jgi:hypothetical protein
MAARLDWRSAAEGFRVVSVREDLVISLVGIDTHQMLEFWRWLIPTSHRPMFATALGDLFLADADGRVLWLDMGDGQLQVVAANEADFKQATTDPDNASLWFGAVLVDELRASGKVLSPSECYCYLQLPMLGGKYEPANFRVYNVVTHFRVWGPIHEQLRDSPDGSTIEFEVVNAPPRNQAAEPGAEAAPRPPTGV